MRDMMKILPFILLKSYFNSDEFKGNAGSVNLPNNKLPKYLSYASDITKILNDENPMNNWRLFIKQLISKVLPEVFTEGDGDFEFNKKNDINGVKTFKYIIRTFDEIDVSEQFIEAFSTACGDIHELFRKYAGGKEAKDFGGFNTPRHALNMIYQFPPIKELIEEKIKDEGCSIYDPTMGTGGFLTRFYKTFDISPDNIYGCELSPDTIKFAFVSLFMTTQKILKNCESCNSLTETNNLHKQETIGLANPPFGTKIKYKKWKKNGETFDGELETYDKKYPGHSVKFKDIYPVETNNGACLFTQHFVYKIKENGLGIIILPDGELFDGNSKWSKTFREWFLTNVNLKMIIKMPQGTFEHAGVKTNVLVFIKNGKTENIQYFDTTKECNVVKELFTITEEDLKSTNYSLDMSDYIEEEETNFEVPMVKLSDICDFKWGKNIPKRDRVIKTENNYPYYGSNGISGYTENFTFEGRSMLLGDQGSQWFNSLQLTGTEEKYNISNHTINISVKGDKYFDYVYYVLKSFDLKQFNKDSAMIPEINFNRFKDFKIPLPSLEIQEKIVEGLSMIETNIKSIETRIKQLKEEKETFKKYSRKSEIKELLKDADIKKLGEVCEINGGTRIVKKNNTEGQYPVYGSGNESFTTTTFNREGLSIIVGRFALSTTCVRLINKKLYLNDSGLTIHHDNELYQLFIGYYMLNNQYNIYNMSRGQAQRNLDMEKFKVMKTPVPSPEIQEQCIKIYQEKETFIQSIDDKIEAEKIYINDLKKLTKDIIYSHC
jgi:type I restriction-modification system DNA methylase subunit